ncbi:hypothetical protein BHE74_00042819, partial [Ensete ventricosum]
LRRRSPLAVSLPSSDRRVRRCRSCPLPIPGSTLQLLPPHSPISVIAAADHPILEVPPSFPPIGSLYPPISTTTGVSGRFSRRISTLDPHAAADDLGHCRVPPPPANLYLSLELIFIRYSTKS